jgi:hypothetical protein
MLILGHDWYDWLMLILVGVSTISVLFGVTIQLPKIQQSLENITKSYNATASERLTITDGVTACITHAKAPHIIECSTCREYPVEELNATLRVCDIIIIDSIANTTNRTEELRILR